MRIGQPFAIPNPPGMNLPRLPAVDNLCGPDQSAILPLGPGPDPANPGALPDAIAASFHWGPREAALEETVSFDPWKLGASKEVDGGSELPVANALQQAEKGWAATPPGLVAVPITPNPVPGPRFEQPDRNPFLNPAYETRLDNAGDASEGGE